MARIQLLEAMFGAKTQPLNALSDIDDLDTGIYGFGVISHAIAQGMPVELGGALIVWRSSANLAVRLYLTYSLVPELWYQRKTGAGWQPWVKML